jgi:lipopolysaccharide transport system permease protein
LVVRDVQARYRGSIGGGTWAVIQPLILLGLFSFVFAEILKVRLGPEVGTANFPLFLFCGILPWQALSESLSRSASTLLENASLIKKNLFPVEVLPVTVALSGIVSQVIGTVILVAMLLVTGHGLALATVTLPLLLGLQFLLMVGLGWMLASLNVFLRDIGQILGAVLTLWVFLTPIFYPPSAYPRRFAFLVALNPLALLVEGYRDVLLRGLIPSAAPLAGLALFAVAVFVSGHWLFGRLRPGFADLL